MSLVRFSFLILATLVFLAFGLVMLWTSYQQDHPIVFLALFFSSNLIVLLSAAGLVGLIWRLVRPEDRITAGESVPEDE